jgi:hypothetical protein
VRFVLVVVLGEQIGLDGGDEGGSVLAATGSEGGAGEAALLAERADDLLDLTDPQTAVLESLPQSPLDIFQGPDGGQFLPADCLLPAYLLLVELGVLVVAGVEVAVDPGAALLALLLERANLDLDNLRETRRWRRSC